MAASHRWVLAAIALSTLFALAGGAWFYNAQELHLREVSDDELQTIARLKVDQIAAFRAERLADAAVISASPVITRSISEWIRMPSPERTTDILALFRAEQTHYHYGDVLLVDPIGAVLLSLSDKPASLAASTVQAVETALRERRPILTDLHTGPADSSPHLDTIAPVYDVTGGSPMPVGAVILRSDAQQSLYPVIESWPAPSRTAETLLGKVRKTRVSNGWQLRRGRDSRDTLTITA
jgi:hypothetical protein